MSKLTDHSKSILPGLIAKQVFIVGDFALSLLNFDSHAPTVNLLTIFFMQFLALFKSFSKNLS